MHALSQTQTFCEFIPIFLARMCRELWKTIFTIHRPSEPPAVVRLSASVLKGENRVLACVACYEPNPLGKLRSWQTLPGNRALLHRYTKTHLFLFFVHRITMLHQSLPLQIHMNRYEARVPRIYNGQLSQCFSLELLLVCRRTYVLATIYIRNYCYIKHNKSVGTLSSTSKETAGLPIFRQDYWQRLF